MVMDIPRRVGGPLARLLTQFSWWEQLRTGGAAPKPRLGGMVANAGGFSFQIKDVDGAVCGSGQCRGDL